MQLNDGGKAASQAYWNALNMLRDAWRYVLDEELETPPGNRAKEAFENALDQVKKRLNEDAVEGERLRNRLDVDSSESIRDVLLGRADLDDRTPNQIKAAMFTAFQGKGVGRFELSAVLRDVLDALFDARDMRRPRVGANRHWPRLLQYLREIEEETDWSPDGRGIKLTNSGGRGPVASEPRDPLRLCIIINPDYL